MMETNFITNDKIIYHQQQLGSWLKGQAVNPITVEIHLTEKCNNRCFYCNYEKSNKEMCFKDFKKAVKKLSEIKVKGLIFSGGGDPLLYAQLSSALSLTASYKIDAAIITNLLSEDAVKFQAILNNCLWCRISLDSSNRSVYRKIRGTDSFDRVIRNINSLVKMKKKEDSSTTLGVQTVVNRYNYKDIFDEIKMVSEFGVDYFQIRPVETKLNERLKYSKKQYGQVLDQVEKGRRYERRDFKIIWSQKWDTLNPYKKNRKHGFSFCHAYQMILAIDVSGDAYACCHQIENKNQELLYGNIFRQPIKKIMSCRKEKIKKIDLTKCYLECRASSINKYLEKFKKTTEHKNFL